MLPYESRKLGVDSAERWLLKLHGDVAHPRDIVLTEGHTWCTPTPCTFH